MEVSIRGRKAPLVAMLGFHHDPDQCFRSALCICSLVGKGPLSGGSDEHGRPNCLKIFWRFFNSANRGNIFFARGSHNNLPR